MFVNEVKSLLQARNVCLKFVWFYSQGLRYSLWWFQLLNMCFSVLIYSMFHLWLIMLILQWSPKIPFVCSRFLWMMLFSREQSRSKSLDFIANCHWQFISTWSISITFFYLTFCPINFCFRLLFVTRQRLHSRWIKLFLFHFFW